jgi:hypothetical protein
MQKDFDRWNEQKKKIDEPKASPKHSRNSTSRRWHP